MPIRSKPVWVLVATLASSCQAERTDQPLPADAARERPAPAEDIVRVRSGDRRLVFRGPDQVKPECFGGHKGFRASAGGDHLHLNVFIFEPGTYRCDAPMPLVFMRWQGTGSAAEYEVTPLGSAAGSCELVVETVQPRMRATFSARLDRAGNEGPEQVHLTEGEMDIRMVASCP
jgi:hypothetical protein